VQLGDQLGAGVAGAHHDEGAARSTFLGVVAGVGQLELLEDVVAQEDAFGEGLEAARVLDQAGDRQQSGDRAGGQDQVVPGEGARLAFGRLDVAGALVDVDPRDLADDQPRAVQHAAERDDDVPGLDRAGGGLRQQRRVEHEVLGVDEHDLGHAGGQLPLEVTRGVHAPEPTADHQDPLAATHQTLPVAHLRCGPVGPPPSCQSAGDAQGPEPC